MRKLLYTFLLLSVMLWAFSPIAFAVANPDSISIQWCGVFRNVLTTGDQLWVVEHAVIYGSTSLPVESASSTFLFSIYGTDGTTLRYSRALNYYGTNIISIYLTPSQALTWESAYYIKIMGNPAYFSLTEGVNMITRVLGNSSFYEADELPTQLISVALDLQDVWGTTIVSNNKLNTTGSTYFREAIPNLNSMVPEIFQETTAYMQMGNASGNITYGNVTRMGPGFMAMLSDLGNMTGVSTGWAGFGFLGMGMLLIASVTYSATRQPVVGVVFGGAFVLIAGAWIGIIAMQTTFVIVVSVAMLFGIAFILRRLA